MKSPAYGTQPTHEFANVTLRLWKRGSKTRAFVARGIAWRSFWFSSFRPGYEVRDISLLAIPNAPSPKIAIEVGSGTAVDGKSPLNVPTIQQMDLGGRLSNGY